MYVHLNGSYWLFIYHMSMKCEFGGFLWISGQGYKRTATLAYGFCSEIFWFLLLGFKGENARALWLYLYLFFLPATNILYPQYNCPECVLVIHQGNYLPFIWYTICMTSLLWCCCHEHNLNFWTWMLICKYNCSNMLLC